MNSNISLACIRMDLWVRITHTHLWVCGIGKVNMPVSVSLVCPLNIGVGEKCILA